VFALSRAATPASSLTNLPSSSSLAPKITSLQWDGSTPPSLSTHPELKDISHVINFCGDNIATTSSLGPIRPWEQPGKLTSIISSRTESTQGLISWLEENEAHFTSAQVHVVSAGGVGIYGCDHTLSSHPVDEDESSPSDPRGGFLAETSRAWEAAVTTAALPARFPTTILRIAPVLLRSTSVLKAEGVLKSLIPPFFFGGGGPVGSGDQLFPFIGERDFTSIVRDHILPQSRETSPGTKIYNVISPDVISNSQFSHSLSAALGRPCLIPLPAFVVKLLFGRMGEEVLLGGVTCKPSKLLEEGFKFKDASVDDAMRYAVGEVKLP
jgi:uncharacterized protein (TIGR01777 family)